MVDRSETRQTLRESSKGTTGTAGVRAGTADPPRDIFTIEYSHTSLWQVLQDVAVNAGLHAEYDMLGHQDHLLAARLCEAGVAGFGDAFW